MLDMGFDCDGFYDLLCICVSVFVIRFLCCAFSGPINGQPLRFISLYLQ